MIPFLGAASVAGALEVGQALPKLEAINQDGERVVIQAREGEEWLLVFTFPKALTPG